MRTPKRPKFKFRIGQIIKWHGGDFCRKIIGKNQWLYDKREWVNEYITVVVNDECHNGSMGIIPEDTAKLVKKESE